MTPHELMGSILSLAVQGKLVEQLDIEGTAESLYKHLIDKKQRMIKEGAAKKSKTLSAITEEEKLFDIPEGWRWIKLGEISSLITKGTTPRGGNVSYLDTGVGFLRAENVAGLDKLDKSNLKCIDEDTHLGFLQRSVLEANDVLITIAGTLGRTAIVREEDLPLNANQAVSLIRLVAPTEINLIYLVYALNSPELQAYLTKQKKVTAIPNLTLEIIENCLLPLPPLAEQKRIVAKIEELLPLIDRYEQAWSKLEEFNKRFPLDMQKSILQTAIQGKLVEQRPEEGTGEELFRQIQAEKQCLIKAGTIKKEKPLPEITEEEKPYDIPSNWTWVRFGDLGSYKKGPFGSAITKSMFVPKGNGAVKVYEQKNAIQKDATLGDYYISREYFESKMKGFELFPGDIIVSCAGTIGETYVMPDKFEQGIINQALMRMKIFEPLYIPYFLIFFDFVLKKDARSSSKGSAIKNIPPFEILKNYLVPLPPLAEQKRIVAKLEEILPLCERLK